MFALLPVFFFCVAWLYSMAGFGGGSTYIALLAMTALPLSAIPVVALSCNLIVSSQGSFVLLKKGYAEWSLLSPLLLGSIPSAVIGGAWRLPDETFVVLLASALSLAGGAMLVQGRLQKKQESDVRRPSFSVLILVGIGLGLLAGLTGIGGGIYLAPVMHLLSWARAQQIAACTSFFIAVNSLAGLIGQLTKGSDLLNSMPVWILLGCPLAVLCGGRIGSYLLSSKLPHLRIRLITACLVLLVSTRLWIKVIWA